MADARVLPISNVKAGIKAETDGNFGVGLDDTGADGTAYHQLNMVQVQKPVFNITRESRLLSGRGSIKNADDTIISQKGGTVTMPFDMIATPKLLSQHMALVGQQHSESGSGGSEVHETKFDGSSNATSVGGGTTNNIPHSVNLAYYPAASEGIRICGAVCSDLSISADYGTNGGFLSMSGNYFSGFSKTETTSTKLETDFTIANWNAPATSYYHIGGLTTKTLDVEGNATQNLVLKSFNFDISNGVNRIGFNANGNAEAYSLPEYVITGSISLKYDDEFDYGSGNNVIQDFLDGDTMSLALKWGDIESTAAAGEMNILAEIQYTGDPAQDISENGIFHNLSFECVQNSSTSAFVLKQFVGSSQSAW